MLKTVIVLFLIFQVESVYALATAKATVLVVDENGAPIVGVDAGLGFSAPKNNGWGSKSSGNRGLTDQDGKYTSSGATERILRYGARHPGYYTSRYKFIDFTGTSGILGFRKWQPWNPTLKVILKKIKNPIAMYAYHTDVIDIPKQGDFIGYDLVKHDWVTPYGKGITADFLFKLDHNFVSKIDYETIFSIKFSNLADGIQGFSLLESHGSILRSAHHAPETGYQNKLIQSRLQQPNKRLVTSYNYNTSYYFRIRCNGDKLDSCLYGKIYRNIEFSENNLSFTYYLNPSNVDTNVEFDPNSNLFKKLKSTMHEVNAP